MDPNDIHKITRGEIEHILKCLRLIDAPRDALLAQAAGHDGIIDELRKSANGIYHVVKQLPRLE